MNKNIFPYYDDFNANKLFYEILFKPGYSVQARELTQLQSILQNQMKQFGNAIFKQGTVITGCAESHNFKTPFVKINDIDTSVYPLSHYEGMTVTAPNGVTAIIKKTLAGSVAEAPNLNTLYLHYISSNITDTNPDLVGKISTFSANQVLTVTGDNAGVGSFMVASVEPVGLGSLFSMHDGIVYVNGRFVIHNAQTIVIDRYSSTPTKKVGFRAVDDIVTAIDDPTLNDPAQGSYNFNAPGADRHRITTELYAYDGIGTKPVDFFLLFDVEAGVIKRRFDKTEYSQLSREFATRTYDESGDYTVRPFPIIVNEHLLVDGNHGKYAAPTGDASKLVAAVEAGKAYVRGYEHELFSSEFLEVDKSLATSVSQNRGTSTFFGNYILVTGVAGAWRLNTSTLVSLRDTAWTYGAFPETVSGGGAEIGTARVRNIEWVTNTGEPAVYRLYLHDIVFTSGGSIENIRGFRLDEGHTSWANVFGTPALHESKFVAPIFPLPQKNVVTLGDSSFVYKRLFNNQAVDSGGVVTLTLPSSEEWAFGTTPSAEQIEQNVRVTVIEDGDSGFPVTNSVSQLDVLNVVSITPQTLTIVLVGGTVVGVATVDVLVSVRNGVAVAQQKTLRTNRFVKLAGGEGPFSLGLHDVISIERVWASAVANPYPTEEPTPTDPLWTDVTSWFDLDDGQRDTFYGLASISKNANAGTLTGQHLIVKLNFFEHSSSGGFYSVDSYPLPVQGEATASTQIDWFAIPSYTTRAGLTFDLRDCLDFRATANNTAIVAETIGGATENPDDTVTFGAGIITPDPTGTFLADLTYNLPRADRIILDDEGTFAVVQGTPSENPVTPKQPDNAMTLALLNIPAFPALSPFYARQVGKPELATTITFVDNRRFTMRDIGGIQRRMERLEQYASLSVLEQQTANMLIPDETGLDRFKNGIVVDALTGHSVGNVSDEDYACSIANGELRPFFHLDNVAMEFDGSSTNVMRKSNDKAIVVRQTLVGTVVFTAGEAITSDDGGSADLRYLSVIASDASYRWVRLYLENASGIIAEDSIITGMESGAVGIVPTATPVVAGVTFPALVSTPTDGNLVTLPYTHEVYVESPYATKSRNCASDILFNFSGSMELSPASDEWPDTSVRPEILFNTDGISDNWASMSTPWGTQWEDWKTLWQKYDAAQVQTKSGAIDPSVLTTTQRQLRDGIAMSLEEGKNVNIIPYMRSVVVTFRATRMKHNTTVFPFFDGVDVSTFCKREGNEYGTPLITCASGTITGQFRIPAETFVAGCKDFILTDVSSDPFSPDATTMAHASYVVTGDRTFDENSILSTQKPWHYDIHRTSSKNNVTERLAHTSESGATDPIAQTFFVSNSEGGSVLTKMGVYFRTKSATSPITLQLRETKNGFPTDIALPYSTVTLSPADINTSEDGTAVTEFTFSSPVYLKNNTEYAFVLLPTGNDTGYNVWVGEFGALQIGTTTVVDKQANAGILYVAGNDRTWTPLINEDIKFTIFRASFTSTGTLALRNRPIEYMTFSDMTGTFYPGDVIEGTQNAGEGIIQHFNYETNEAQVLVTAGSFGDVNGVDVVSSGSLSADTLTTKKAVDAISPNLSYLDFNNTSLSWGYRIYEFNGTPYGVGYTDMSPAGTIEFLSPKAVFSDSDYAPSFMMQGVMQTASPNISPIVDLEKVGCVIIANAISNATGVVVSEAASGGLASSRYISRTAILDDGQEADDLMVFLSAKVPTNATYHVFAKLSSPDETVAFADRPWTLMVENVVQGTAEFHGWASNQERFYTLPPTEGVPEMGFLNAGVYQYTRDGVTHTRIKAFAIKIIFISNDTTRVPKIRDLRTIALQA